MTRHEFHNALRVLTSVDHHEVPFLTGTQWHAFRTDPFRFFVRCDDETCAGIWAAIERRTVRRAA